METIHPNDVDALDRLLDIIIRNTVNGADWNHIKGVSGYRPLNNYVKFLKAENLIQDGKGGQCLFHQKIDNPF